ncbi:GNAT family N-acetyltransferase [Sporosarcina sp. USHLN248]|uniref:GNAT family N-acetyltransferase n=1 Tax=Sporosarcina sp. USHLN248 TaxID=3081300 RepID=UPI00301B3DB3
MKLIRINTLEQLHKVRGEWAQILEDNQNSNPFIEFEWISLWIECLGSQKNIEVIGIQNELGSYIGFFPFIKKKSLFGVIYEMIGYGQSNYMDFIIRHDDRNETIRFCFEKMIEEEPNALFILHGILESSPTYPTLISLLKRGKYGYSFHKVVAPYINLNKIQMDHYLEKRKKLHRLERREKRLHLLGKVEHRVCTVEEMDTIFYLHDKRWQKKNDTSGFTNEAERTFYKKLMETDSGQMRPVVDALYVEGKMIAFAYGFSCRNRYVSFVLGYDDDFESFSPGRMLEKESIIRFVNTDVTIFDLSIGYEPYKFEWNTHLDHAVKLIFSSKGFRSAIRRIIRSMREKSIERLKKNRKTVLFKRDTLGYMKYMTMKLFRNPDRNARKEAFRQLFRTVKSSIWQKDESFIMKKGVERTKKAGLGKGFSELQLNDALYNKRFNNQDLKTVCTKLYGGYQGYYRTGERGEGEIVWANRKVLRLKNIPYIKELRKNAIWLEGWNEHNVQDICEFVHKEHLINSILVEVEAKDFEGIKILKKVGFQIEKSAASRTIFGKKNVQLFENYRL